MRKVFNLIGTKTPRLDHPNKAMGKALYADDITLPNMLYAKAVRSPYAHARIRKIDTNKAAKLPGVKAIITANDVPHTHIFGIDGRDEPFLSWDGTVRYVGQEVAAVAALDRDLAEEAAGLIDVEWEPLPAVLTAEEAVTAGAPLVHPEIPAAAGNVAFAVRLNRGDVEEGFARADVVVEEDYVTGTANQAYLEPEAAVASYDASGRLTVYVGSTWPSNVRDELALVLQIPQSKVRVVQNAVGGAFGARFTGLPVHHIAAALAIKAGRPVKHTLSRFEDFLTQRNRSNLKIHWKMGALRDGTLTAVQSKFLFDQGAYVYMIKRMLTHMCCRSDGLYRVPNIRHEATAAYTNKTPNGTFRSFGDLEMAWGREQTIDLMAHKLGLSPLEMRLKNAHRRGDVSAHGWQLNSCALTDCLKAASEELGYADKLTHKKVFRGVGLACTCHETDDRTTEGSYGSVTYIKLLEDGKVNVLTGEADTGQGSHNAIAMTVAEELGLPMSDIIVLPHDSDVSPWAWGYLGSRVMSSAVEATYKAAQDVKAQALEVAAKQLNCAVEELEFVDGRVTSKSFPKNYPEKSLTLGQIGRCKIHEQRDSAAIIGRGIDERPTVYTLGVDHPTHYGHSVSSAYYDTTAVEVEVDTETGQIKVLRVVVADDCGKVIDRLSIEGQVDGATMQGIGAALMEERVYDPKHEGRLANADFDDYHVPLSVNVPPEIKRIFVESDEPSFCYGHKGGGESPGIGSVIPAIASAVYDAVGIRLTSFPMTPDKVLRALAEKEAAERAAGGERGTVHAAGKHGR